MTASIKYYIPAIAWAGFILFATIANVSTLRELHLQDLFAYDKPIHAILFGTQAWLLLFGRRKTTIIDKHFLAVVCLVCFGYGVLTEILQGVLTDSRFFDYFDMIADGLGCLVVYLWNIIKTKQTDHS